jgi:hypothetical protein
MMARSKTRVLKEEAPVDRDFEGIKERDDTQCADEIWEYVEAHMDEAEDLEEWAKRRGLKA